MPVQGEQARRMRWILFGIFVVLFVIIVLGTLGAVFLGFGDLSDTERSTLFKAFLVEIGAAVLALFYSLFGLKRKGETEGRVRLTHHEKEKMADLRKLVNKTATLSPSRSDSSSLDDIKATILDDNGPFLQLNLLPSAFSVYITVDTGYKPYSGSFVVGNYLVEMEEEQG